MRLGSSKSAIFSKALGALITGWLLAGLFTPLGVYAQQQPAPVTGTREFLLGNPNNQDLGEAPVPDIRMSGLYDRRDIVLSMPASWTLRSGSFIELRMNHSALLLPETSNLTILINDQPVNSVRLDKTNQADAVLNIPISTSSNFQPVKGRLLISIMARMRINDMLCPPVDDRASWINFSGGSKATLNYSEAPPTSLSELSPLLFGSINTLDRRVTVVVPPNPTTRDLTRASQLVTRLGAMAGVDGLDISMNYGALAQPNTHQILVGGPEMFGLLKDFALPIGLGANGFNQNNAPVAENTGVVQFGTAPNRTGITLVVSGNGQDGVDRALQSLLDDRSLGILRGAASLVLPDSQYVKPLPSLRGTPSTALNGRNIFNQMGYENQTVTGYGIQDTYFSFSIPAFNTITGPGQLVLDYNFSRVVDARRSSVSVILNDVLLGGDSLGLNATNQLPNSQAALTPQALAPRPTEPEQITIKLPKDLLRSGDNRVTIRFALYLSSGQPCGEISTFNDLWGVVYNTSALVIQATPTTANTPALDQLPYPFAGGIAGSLMILPEKPDPAELRLAAQMLAEFGRNEPVGQFGRLLIANPKQVTSEQLAQNNVVLIGKPDTNSLLGEVNTKLPVAWNSDTERLLNTQRGLRFGANDNNLAALIEVANSPWSAQQSLLAVVSEPGRTDGGKHLVSAIGRRLYIGKYKGNVMALDSRGKTYIFNTKDRVAPEVAPEDVTPGSETPSVAIGNPTPGAVATTAETSGLPAPTPTVSASQTSTKPASGLNSSSLLGLGLLGLVGVGALGLAGFFLWRRQRLAASRKLRK